MNDQLLFGGIGIRGRGMSDLRQLLSDQRVRFVGIADVRESARETGQEHRRQLLQEQRLQDVPRSRRDCWRAPTSTRCLIATSDRWHGPMAMWAAQSGKDMYIEKPGAMSINESYAVADNVRRYGVVYQSGCQRKNQFAFEFAVGLARSGKLGRLLAVHADTAIGLGTVDAGRHGWWAADKPEPDPLVFDWDKWLGPASGGRGTRPIPTAAAASSGTSTPACSSGRRTPSRWPSGRRTWSTPQPVEYVPQGRPVPRRRADRALHHLLPLREWRQAGAAQS